jgi:uncharacterized membrane protein YesL
MKTSYKKFILHTIILGVLLTLVGLLLFVTIIPSYYHPYMPAILVIAMLINIFTFRLMIGSTENIMKAIIKSFALKFFSYIALAIIILLSESEKTARITLILSEFVLYIIFTFHEVNSYIRVVKNDSKM